ncbi:MAG: ABC transporter ATP-binding protein [Myxococcota bacterium]
MTPEATTLAAQGLAHHYGQRAALADVSLTLEPGTVTAIVGPNGAGKSTLLRVLAGLQTASAGAVRVGGQPLESLSPSERARRIAFAGGEPALPFAWTATELVLMARAPHLGRRLFETAADLALARAALADAGAEAFADRPVYELSAGERQRVFIARALCQDTPVLLLDEPTSHQDPAQAVALGALIRRLAAAGRAVACVLHDLTLAARVADRVLILAAGRVAGAGPSVGILNADLLKSVYGAHVTVYPGPPPVIAFGPAAP